MADQTPSHFDHRARMLAGKTYFSGDASLVAERSRTFVLLQKYNTTDPADRAAQIAILRELFQEGVAHLTDDEMPTMIPPLFCDYGSHVSFGKHVFFNFGTQILDVCPIKISDRVLLGTFPTIFLHRATSLLQPTHRKTGPSVSLSTAEHAIAPTTRNGVVGAMYGKPITIGDDVWVGGGAIVVAGVKIGNGTTVGAGSVVTRSLPSMSVAVGNPARVVRKIVEDENWTVEQAWDEGGGSEVDWDEAAGAVGVNGCAGARDGGGVESSGRLRYCWK
ncbi:hypothetical protein AMAG_06769 [Allomyces macrogynus ATCC 38327]|uniref:Maltose/galactoside acetyltransferase domain-containing protein n=1 Tax=Allomyces macrogynus (strain ATCC 38327) TaxID=578462 RepID=A0A0L0SF04_ALLM3|nr:hypothetical protein AMAG_06769 [Allomyces macrogynus ATCC 38327]|eukprot:KNE61009.1 hypothetical protein AMAG_06769 [Allomyces macrogynus ATCC 38327]